MDKVAKDMQSSIPTNFEIDSNLNMSSDGKGTVQSEKTVIEHKGVIEVRGVNSKNELTGVVEIIMDEFRREARIR